MVDFKNRLIAGRGADAKESVILNLFKIVKTGSIKIVVD